MSTTHRSLSEGNQTADLPLFLITLPRAAKSQEIFRLTALCHIAIGVEAYRAQNSLTQCHNCQQFGHVWANYKQSPRCLWWWGGHLHKECPEKENAFSTPACCNCKLLDGARILCWVFSPSSPQGKHWPAKKKTWRHRRLQPRLAATEGVSFDAHQIRRASLCVSVIITAVNICDSYVGVSSIDIPQ
jgi:hypothetical protein